MHMSEAKLTAKDLEDRARELINQYRPIINFGLRKLLLNTTYAKETNLFGSDLDVVLDMPEEAKLMPMGLMMTIAGRSFKTYMELIDDDYDFYEERKEIFSLLNDKSQLQFQDAINKLFSMTCLLYKSYYTNTCVCNYSDEEELTFEKNTLYLKDNINTKIGIKIEELKANENRVILN